MYSSKHVYIKYVGGKAIITNESDNNIVCKIYGSIDESVLNDSSITIFAEFASQPKSRTYAYDCSMKGYSGNNLESFNRFVDFIIKKINDGLLVKLNIVH
jgi:hypothetical protein